MTNPEKIPEGQFREILQADLSLCSQAYDLLASYQSLKRQRLVFWVSSGLILVVLAGLGTLVWALELGRGWLAVVAGVTAVCLGILWRQYQRLGRSIVGIRSRWEQTRLVGRNRQIIQLVADMARKVIDYNQLVDRLEALQSGDFWRDFRKLSDTEKQYIDTTFVQVRGQILAALRACRQLLDDPKATVADTLSRQLVSRDQVMVHEFTAKTMTSNQYLKLAQELSEMESSLQQQLSSLAK